MGATVQGDRVPCYPARIQYRGNLSCCVRNLPVQKMNAIPTRSNCAVFARMLVAFVSFLFSDYGYAQGTITQISFEAEAIRSGQLLVEYHESGVAFTAYGTGQYDWGFNGWVSGMWPQRPDNGNGSAYLTPGALSTVSVSLLSTMPFDFVSVDLSEEGSWWPNPVPVQFIGYHPDGSTVTNELTTDGFIDGTGPLADFQTFYFGPGFTGLTRVEIPGSGWSMDNLVLSIPEPEVGTLVIVGGIIFCCTWLGRARRPQLRNHQVSRDSEQPHGRLLKWIGEFE